MTSWLSQSRAMAPPVPEALLYPWERGFLGVVFGHRLPLEPYGYRGLEVPVRVEPALVAPAQVEPARTSPDREWQPAGVCATTRVPRLRGTRPVDEDAARAPIVARWRWLLEIAAADSDLHRRSVCGGEEALSRALADACYPKSTATLRKRASALAQYLDWAGGSVGLPITETRVYQYVSHLRQEGAPATRATSFLEAVSFAIPLM